MVEEILVKEPLTSEMIKSGADVLQALRDANYPMDALFWLYTSDANTWRLTIASPSVSDEGPLKAYAQLRQVLTRASVDLRSLVSFGFSIISSDDVLVRALVLLNRKGKIAEQRFSKGYFFWVYVEDIYVYFVNDSLDVAEFEGASGFAYTQTPEGPKKIKWRRMRHLGDKPDRTGANGAS